MLSTRPTWWRPGLSTVSEPSGGDCERQGANLENPSTTRDAESQRAAAWTDADGRSRHSFYDKLVLRKVRRVVFPAQGTPAARLAAGVPCTILFHDPFRPGGALAHLRRANRPGARGKGRQVEEQLGADLWLAGQRCAAPTPPTASPSATASPRVLIWPQWTVMLSGATKVRTQVSATSSELDHLCCALSASCAPLPTFSTLPHS